MEPLPLPPILEPSLTQSEAVIEWIKDIQRQREHALALSELQAWGYTQCHWARAINPPENPNASPTARADVVETVER
jgi:hypothetical protein